MSWNYRVLRHQDPDGAQTYMIHEVHYDAEDRPTLATERGAAVLGDGRRELLLVLADMADCLSKPVLDGKTLEEVEPVMELSDHFTAVIRATRKILD